MEAAHQGHVDLVKFLINSGADLHLETGGGDTALSFACENGHNEVAEILLNCGAKLEHESEGGRTPLMKAARAGHVCTVQFLVSRGYFYLSFLKEFSFILNHVIPTCGNLIGLAIVRSDLVGYFRLSVRQNN